jgi:short-subunit dehydrogenase
MTVPRTVLITGASNGIGAALAERYAAPGVALALTGRNAVRLAAVAARCSSKGAKCYLQTLDVRDSAALLTWIATIDAATPIDLAIINAGLAATRASLEMGERSEDMLAQIDTNLGGNLLAAQAIGALMFQRKRGHLALVSSLNGLFPVAEAPTYSATKAAILAYTEAIRDWLEPAGICVTAICPGFVRTGIAERYTGPRPFEISSQQAARKIAAGLGRRRRMISFPLPLVAAIYFGKLMPRWVRRRVVAAYTAQLAPLTKHDTTRPGAEP